MDVPGHEKFIKNMLTGAGGIDLAMLIIAADDGVMPQTVEHLDILTLLGVRDGLIVITKADIVDPEWLEMMAEEVKEKSVEELAQEVLEGRHGNGEDRRKNLGGMYCFVQDRVNEILAERQAEATTKAAWAVIRGDYGEHRIQRLKEAGYEPEEVQNRVNQLLRNSNGR